MVASVKGDTTEEGLLCDLSTKLGSLYSPTDATYHAFNNRCSLLGFSAY